MKRSSLTRSPSWQLAVVACALPLLAGCLPSRSEGDRLYRRHCQECHGVDGGGGIMYLADEGADLLDETWRLGGDRSSLAYALEPGTISEHSSSWEFTGKEIDLLVAHVRALRGERR